MVRQNTDNRWIAKMNARLLHGSPKCTRARCTLAEMLATLVRFAVRFAIPLAGVDKALDFSVFGYLKNEVYKRQMNNLNQLMEEITNCCRNINEQMLQNIFQNKKMRVKPICSEVAYRS
jgi:hypothetical protein